MNIGLELVSNNSSLALVPQNGDIRHLWETGNWLDYQPLLRKGAHTPPLKARLDSLGFFVSLNQSDNRPQISDCSP